MRSDQRPLVRDQGTRSPQPVRALPDGRGPEEGGLAGTRKNPGALPPQGQCKLYFPLGTHSAGNIFSSFWLFEFLKIGIFLLNAFYEHSLQANFRYEPFPQHFNSNNYG